MVQKKTSSLKNSLVAEAVILQLRRRFRQVTGVFISCMALIFAITLFSYSPKDPSLNTATTIPVHNLLDLPGAIVADFFIQNFGLSSLLLSIVILVWGGLMIIESTIKQLSLRIMSLIIALLAASTFLGLFVNKTIYLATPTLGGAFGTLALTALSRLSGLMPGITGLIAFSVFILFLNYSLAIRFYQWQGFLEKIANFCAACGRKIGAFLIKPTSVFIQKTLEGKNVIVSTSSRSSTTKETGFDRKSTIILNTDGDLTASNVVISKNSEREATEEITDFAPLFQETIEEKYETAATFVDSKVAVNVPKKPSLSTPSEFIYIPSQNEDYQLPSIEFLQKTVKKEAAVLAPEVLQKSAHQLEQVLQEFGVRGEIVAVCPGPVVTLYELKPAAGIKTSRVIGLADDIARSMSAHAARIAVISGRNVIGIELPNLIRETVYLRELLQTDEYTKFSAPLALILGKDIGGNPIIADLARMPHLLVAGTTGSGKSVAINTMILSILFRLSPDKCKFIMIDPKMLELSVYDGIPHLLSPVVTDPKKAVVALKWAVREMENRYRAMSKLGVRNIDGYNARLAEARLSGELLMRRVQTGFDPDTGKPIFENQSLAVDPLPYIVVVVDEMADLMLVAGKEIEAAVQRLAQMARAAGIHLIMATQRPSVDVITGTIKANFPTRISFQVTSKIDSRTILGEQGAEQLLGQGDMLYMMGGGRVSRVHGPFVRDDEVEKIVQFLKMQGEPAYIESITEDDEESTVGSSEEENRSGEPLYQQAIEVIRREGKVSTSFIQRHLQIGYNRAARIIEQMEKEGVVGPANHIGKREIL